MQALVIGLATILTCVGKHCYTLAADQARLRKSLEDIRDFGYRKAGFGWSCAKKADEALRDEK